ncbi:MAG: TonB-dependent receptor, partial [Myxococcales bacterium]
AEPPSDEVTVLGNKASKATGSAHVIRRDQLDRQRYDDPHQVLLGVPGVYVRGEDGFGLRPNIGIRGATSDRSKKLALMEDGVLFGPAPYSAPAAYYFPIMARMRAVRVVKGPSAVAYGPQTVGGAIDMLTREVPSTRSGMIDVGIGQYGYRKLHLVFGASDERAGFVIEGVRLASTGFKTIDGDPGADTGYVRNEWMAKGRYELDLGGPGQHELQLKIGYSDERSNETYMGVSDADFKASPYRRYGITRNDQMNWHRTQIEATHRVTYRGGFELVTTAYQHDLARVWNRIKGVTSPSSSISDALLQPGQPGRERVYNVLSGRANSTGTDDLVTFGPNDRAFVARGIQTVMHGRVMTGPVEHRIEYGLRFHYDEIRRQQGEDPQQVVDRKLVPSGAAYRSTDDNLASTHALALHVFDQIAYGRFLLAPGARVEFIQPRLRDYLTGVDAGRSYQVVAPGVGGYAALTRDLGLLAGVYRGFSPAPPEANRDTKPEMSVNYEGGARYTRKDVRAEVIGFFNDYSNLTDICTASNGCTDANLDRQFDAGSVHI